MLRTDMVWTITIEPIPVTVLELQDIGFHFDSATLTPRERSDADREAGGGLVAVAALLRHLRQTADAPKQLMIAGHTDPVGSETYNLDLSLARAANVKLFVDGDRNAWAASSAAKNVPEDLQVILGWFAADYGANTHPGAIDGDIGPRTCAALRNFREAYNAMFDESLALSGPVSEADWAAIFDVYNDHLSTLIDCTMEGLPEYRSAVQYTNPATLGCGEHWQPEQCALKGYAPKSVRRVDFLMFDPTDVPLLKSEPAGDEIYRGAFFEAVQLQPLGPGPLDARYAFSI